MIGRTMTAPRRPAKFCSSKFCSSLSRRRFLAVVLLAAPATVSTSSATTTEQVVTDRNTEARHQRFRSARVFHRWGAAAGNRRLRASVCRGGLALPQRRQPRRLHCRPGGLHAALRRLRSGGDRPRCRGARPRVWLLVASGFTSYTAGRNAFIAGMDVTDRAPDSKVAAGAAHADALRQPAAADGCPRRRRPECGNPELPAVELASSGHLRAARP